MVLRRAAEARRARVWLWPRLTPNSPAPPLEAQLLDESRAHKQAPGAQTEHPSLSPPPLPRLPSGLLTSSSGQCHVDTDGQLTSCLGPCPLPQVSSSLPQPCFPSTDRHTAWTALTQPRTVTPTRVRTAETERHSQPPGPLPTGFLYSSSVKHPLCAKRCPELRGLRDLQDRPLPSRRPIPKDVPAVFQTQTN